VGFFYHAQPGLFHLYASQFLLAARSLPPVEGRFAPVHLYLPCHSIELALKAFLSLKGISANKLAWMYRHNLKRLEKAAASKDLEKYVALTPEMRSAIRNASAYYTGKIFEYPKLEEATKGYPQAPDVSVLMATADLLVASLKAPCEAA
jgi:hypothetical protein